jgi:hypothetical protein
VLWPTVTLEAAIAAGMPRVDSTLAPDSMAAVEAGNQILESDATPG